MKPETFKKWEAAARELWDENQELRSKYNFDLQTYLTTVSARLEWQTNPQLQKEFHGGLESFLAYKRAEAEGLIR